MLIDRIDINQVLPDAGRINGNSKPADKPIPSGRNSPTRKVYQKQDSLSTLPRYRSLWSSDPAIRQLSNQIQSADKALGRIETYIDRMKEQLDTILKKYPPYPLDSPQRNNHLREYTALQREIDSMTIPPLRKEVAAGPNKVNTDLKIPVLPGGSSDQEVSAAVDGLQNAKETVVAGRGQLQTDTTVFADSKSRDAGEAQLISEVSNLEVVVLNEEQTQQKSLELKGLLNTDIALTITTSPARLLQAFG